MLNMISIVGSEFVEAEHSILEYRPYIQQRCYSEVIWRLRNVDDPWNQQPVFPMKPCKRVFSVKKEVCYITSNWEFQAITPKPLQKHKTVDRMFFSIAVMCLFGNLLLREPSINEQLFMPLQMNSVMSMTPWSNTVSLLWWFNRDS
jgi:hypothetical protein